MNDSTAEPGRLQGGLTREVLERDGIRVAFRHRHPDVPLIPDDDIRASIARTLATRPPDAQAVDGVWLFGYGSLLWNPCVAVAERRMARLYGFHRDFRLKLAYGRGSPDAPGLMLGLVPGGSCRGMALRVVAGPDNDLAHELLMVWRREMLTGVYRPRWIRLNTEEGPLSAVAFVVNPAHACYCPRLEEQDRVRLLATGHGVMGTSMEYLENTVSHLDGIGIHDRRLRALRQAVARWHAAAD